MRDERERALDAWLAAAARTGSRDAMGKLAERWHGKLLRHAWRLTGDGDLAADAVQDAWADILRGLHGLDDTRAFAAWAFRITSRRCQRAISGRRRRRESESAAAHEAPWATDSDSQSAQADADTVRAAMAHLPPDQRAALGLFYLEQMRVAEIAIALDAAPGTIKTRLMHARRKLRAQLEGAES